jgi:hypothetical protein
MAAIMQLERNDPDDIINATVAESAEFSRHLRIMPGPTRERQ